MKKADTSLIPNNFDNSPPNYYCTWQLMERVPGNTENSNLKIRDVLTDERLFGENNGPLFISEERKCSSYFKPVVVEHYYNS
ncbi:MAG: hypothetical protein WCN92_02625 [Eubacteriales bacterium]